MSLTISSKDASDSPVAPQTIHKNVVQRDEPPSKNSDAKEHWVNAKCYKYLAF